MKNINQKIKNAVIIGDSYSSFEGCIPDGYATYYSQTMGTDVRSPEQTWWRKFAQAEGVNIVLNDSWSGSTVCYTGRISPEYAYKSSFVNRMHKLIESDFFKKNGIDTVFIFGGTNDSWLKATTPFGEPKFQDFQEENLYSTLPAICYMLKTLREELPDGNIIYIINTGIDKRIASTVKEASEHFKTSYIELEEIDKDDAHPTILGMTQICSQIIAALK